MSLIPSAHRILLARGPELGPLQARELLVEARLLLRDKVRVLILDLGDVAFIDSLGVAAIAAVAEEAQLCTTVVLAGLSPYVMRVIHMTRLHEIVDVYASVEAASRALAA